MEKRLIASVVFAMALGGVLVSVQSTVQAAPIVAVEQVVKAEAGHSIAEATVVIVDRSDARARYRVANDSTVAILDGEGQFVGQIHGELVPSMCDPYEGAATISDSVIVCNNGYTLYQE